MRRDLVNTSNNRIIILLTLNQTEGGIQKICRKDFSGLLWANLNFGPKPKGDVVGKLVFVGL
jgi:hypothetical protein